MKRYGLPFIGIAVAALLAGTCVLVQRQIEGAKPLILQQRFQDHHYAVHSADFDEKEELIASGGGDGLRVWRVDNGHEIYSRPGRIDLVRFLKGNLLLCADANEGVLLLDRNTWQVKRKFGHFSNRIVAAVNPEGDRIAASFSAAPDKDTKPPMSYEIHVWQLAKDAWGESILRGHQGPIHALEFHPHAPHLISCSKDRTTRVWDISSGKQIDQFGESHPDTNSYHAVPEWHSACALNPAGDRLIIAGTLCDYETLGNSPLGERQKKFSGGRCAAFSPFGRWIATGYADGTLHLWDGRTMAERAVVKGSVNGSPLNEVRFSRSGKLIVTVGDGIVPLFSAMRQKVKSNDTVVRVWCVNIPE